ncbi:uncharacterized protein LOC126742348 [Anthonomus grandis grandis]|uniref:uncharacterized protein LOC126742348 n=1 Tax=Anthonomus grandis grandis TaxID=2921223 RepID=UPI00216512DF|nr:uncharacterized protein LOC126742348 [Anthonomus grandis grandis]
MNFLNMLRGRIAFFLLIAVLIREGGFSEVGKNGDYIINTNKCKIPNLPLFSPELNLTRGPRVNCTNFNPLLTYVKDQKLYINQEAVQKYFENSSSIKCCYTNIYRKENRSDPDTGVTVSSCWQFNHSVELQHDLIWVSCTTFNDFHPLLNNFPVTPIYENIHQVIQMKEPLRIKAKRLKKSNTKKPINVLMVVIDSVARLNFIRTMPLTYNFVMDNGFYEMTGYNKVADNTFPNAMAFLTGLNLNDALDVCKPTEITGLNNCPFIWNKYRDAGYATAYGEDWSSLATFNYFKKGFKDPPTDYYFKPYMDAIAYLKQEYQDTMPFCAGPETQGDRILNLAYDFAYKLKSLPTFGLFWMNTFSHNNIRTPATMDVNVKEFFQKLKDSQILDESIVILISDHGVRFGDIINTTRGFYELRLPMHYISLPPWFKQQYPLETKNLKDNSKKLISNYDLYMTLQHILKLSGANYSINSCWACRQCRSFFEYIPDDRSCAEAGIPGKWCTCNVRLSDKSDKDY